MRSTTTSMCCWPIAEMSSSLVWGSRATRIIMSASVTRCSTVESLSSSPLLFGSTAIEITGVGKTIGGKTTGCFSSHSVSPVWVSLSFATAAKSPGPTSGTDLRVLPSTWLSEPARSRAPRVAL